MQTTFAPLESMLECAQGAVNNTSNYVFKYSVNGSARFYLPADALYVISTQSSNIWICKTAPRKKLHCD
jgi:hypothetical protein